MIYLGSDHGGFKEKEKLEKFLKSNKVEYVDLGPYKFQKEDDYPVYAKKVAKAVQKNLVNNKAIMLCRSGQGVCFAANKFKGIRAVIAWNKKIAIESRKDNDANILCLPSDFISDAQAREIVKAWLFTKFSNAPRHIRRIKEVEKFR